MHALGQQVALARDGIGLSRSLSAWDVDPPSSRRSCFGTTRREPTCPQTCRRLADHYSFLPALTRTRTVPRHPLPKRNSLCACILCGPRFASRPLPSFRAKLKHITHEATTYTLYRRRRAPPPLRDRSCAAGIQQQLEEKREE